MILDFSLEAVNAYDKGQLNNTAIGRKIERLTKEELADESMRVEYWMGSHSNELTE